MSTDRRFNEKEIGRIFEAAARAQTAANEQSGSSQGLSLEELKQIGASTGIQPQYIMDAVAALGREVRVYPSQKQLGLPFGVSRSVELPESFSEKEWESVVVDLRKTFGKRGTIKKDGSFREWSYGFNFAYVEPSQGGYELKLESKSDLFVLLYTGILFIIMGFVFLALMAGNMDVPSNALYIFFTLFMAGGIGMFIPPFIKQPRWAKKREQQIEGICRRAAARSKETANEASVPSMSSGQQETTPGKFLSLEDEVDLNEELKQFAVRKTKNRLD